MQKGLVEKMMNATCDYQARCIEARDASNEEYRDVETSEENILRMSIDGLIAHLASHMSEKIESTDDKISYQISLASSFTRTHFMIMDAVLEGDLVEGGTLARKQLESLSRMNEIDSEPLLKLYGKVPNISNILQGEAGSLYGRLSKVAHFSHPSVGELLTVLKDGDKIGPSIYPRYQKEAHALFDIEVFIAIYFCGWMTQKLEEWYPALDLSEDKAYFASTISLANDIGVLRVQDPE